MIWDKKIIMDILGKMLTRIVGKELRQGFNDLLFDKESWKSDKIGVEKIVINSTIIIKHFISTKLAMRLCEKNNVNPVIYPVGPCIIEENIDNIRTYLTKLGDKKLLSKNDDQLKMALLRELKKVNSGI